MPAPASFVLDEAAAGVVEVELGLLGVDGVHFAGGSGSGVRGAHGVGQRLVHDDLLAVDVGGWEQHTVSGRRVPI